MNKALYLVIVFVLPVLTYWIPAHLLQPLWLVLYIPFAAIYAILIWLRPDNEMMVFVSLTPVVFLLVLLVIVFGLVGYEKGALEGLASSLFSAMFAIPVAIIIGSINVLIAFVLLIVFRHYDLLKS